MKYLAPNNTRAAWGFAALLMVAFGAGFHFGFGAALLTIGALLFIDLSTDEALERLTGISRWPADKPLTAPTEPKP